MEMKFLLQDISSSTKWQEYSQLQQRYRTLNIAPSLEDASCRALAQDPQMPHVELKIPNILKKGPLPEDARIISIVKPTRFTNVLNLFYFGKTLYMFRTVFPSISRSSRLYIQQQAFVKQILLSAC